LVTVELKGIEIGSWDIGEEKTFMINQL